MRMKPWIGLLWVLSMGLPTQARDLLLKPCDTSEDDLALQCGKYEVFEDREGAAGRRIKLSVVVVPASGTDKAPDPLFVLAGGPGQAASDLAPLFLGWNEVREQRDVVFVDQRGTGRSHQLQCLPENLEAAVGAILVFRFPNLKDCLSRLDADPRFYTTSVAMDDLDEVRQALGYDKINLWGGSYGSRAALVYLRRHPESVRTVTLRGVAPPPLLVPLSFGQGAQRALDGVLDACVADPDCRTAFPDPHADLQKLLEKADATNSRILVKALGRDVDVELNRDTVNNALLFMLYDAGTSASIPLAVQRALEGDFSPLMSFGATFSALLADQLSLGMSLSVLCAEDAVHFTDERIEKDLGGSFLGTEMAGNLRQACREWPRGDIPPGFNHHVASEAPVLLLSGEFDPVTPPIWAEQAAQLLPNSLHLVAPNTGHLPGMPGCSRGLVERFISQGSVKGLDGSCLDGIQRPSFRRP